MEEWAAERLAGRAVVRMDLAVGVDGTRAPQTGAMVRNAFNNVNLGTFVGNLQSPIFGEANSLARGPFNSQSANRRIDLQVTFSF